MAIIPTVVEYQDARDFAKNHQDIIVYFPATGEATSFYEDWPTKTSSLSENQLRQTYGEAYTFIWMRVLGDK